MVAAVAVVVTLLAVLEPMAEEMVEHQLLQEQLTQVVVAEVCQAHLKMVEAE